VVLLGLMVLALLIAAVSRGCGDDDPTPTGGTPTTTAPTTTSGAGGASAVRVIDQINQEITRTGIQFVTGKSELTAASRATLNTIATILAANAAVRAEVRGHTDNEGDAAKNQQLSQERAQAVVAYLVARGVDAGRLTAVGFGEANPIADNTTEEGRARNRRVEFALAP
jgi:outer membrane protein OmpA-like peptidoglycan-associated protein